MPILTKIKMNHSESIKEITAAIIAVMSEINGVEKNMTVGAGTNSYNGVADQDVKKLILPLMVKNGLSILPRDIEEETEVTRWSETSQYGTKQKQSVFVRVKTTYLLSHISGEWMEIKGIGHGVDSQDKAAGKATTYALKYALLYSFLVPTGKIDDADTTHSDEIPVADKKKDTGKPSTKPPENPVKRENKPKPVMTESMCLKTAERIINGEEGVIAKAEAAVIIPEKYMKQLREAEAKVPAWNKLKEEQPKSEVKPKQEEIF